MMIQASLWSVHSPKATAITFIPQGTWEKIFPLINHTGVCTEEIVRGLSVFHCSQPSLLLPPSLGCKPTVNSPGCPRGHVVALKRCLLEEGQDGRDVPLSRVESPCLSVKICRRWIVSWGSTSQFLLINIQPRTEMHFEGHVWLKPTVKLFKTEASRFSSQETLVFLCLRSFIFSEDQRNNRPTPHICRSSYILSLMWNK